MERVTLKTVADRLGVSRMTVSNAFARPDQLSEVLRARVLAVAEELGYVGPDPAARALARGSTGSVGLLLTESLSEAFTDAFATAFLASVAESLADSGLALTLLTPARPGGGVPARDVAMDGAIVYVCKSDSPDLAWLKRRRLPLVAVDREPVAGMCHVNVDDRAGARAAAQHVLDLGHRRVAILTYGPGTAARISTDALADTSVFAARQRLHGWYDALSPAGVEPVVILAPYRPDEIAYDAVHELLQGKDRPTAVLCFADRYAASVVRAAQDLGLDVPGDLSVVGFDDSALATQLEPQLSTVRQDVQAKARAAVGALTSLLDARRDGAAETVGHVMIPTELIVRDSTAQAPRKRAARGR